MSPRRSHCDRACKSNTSSNKFSADVSAGYSDECWTISKKLLTFADGVEEVLKFKLYSIQRVFKYKKAKFRKRLEQTSRWIGLTSRKAVSFVGPLPSNIFANPIRNTWNSMTKNWLEEKVRIKTYLRLACLAYFLLFAFRISEDSQSSRSWKERERKKHTEYFKSIECKGKPNRKTAHMKEIE